MNVGIIGAGAIATYVLNELQKNEDQSVTVTSLFVRDRNKYEALEEKYNVKLYTNIDEFLQAPMDIVIEAANVSAVKKLFPKVMKQKDVILISIGAFANETFLNEVKSIAKQYNRNIYLPSGAIGGLDLIQNATIAGEISEVSLETRKPAHTLISDQISGEQVIFTGRASDAIKKYPKNMNVSIAIALAGIGFEQTKVTIIADPTINKNIHTINIEGAFGNATFSITNNPLEENPNTSYLAAVSVLGTLKRVTANMIIGS